MNKWSLPKLLANLHYDIQNRLEISRNSFQHSVTKGDASEKVWLELLQTYLPKRYQAETAHVVDSKGCFSEQIDIVVFDRQYSPFIFHYEGQIIIPAESVYAVFECKQAINADNITYAQKKIASVRKLHRTSLPILHAGGISPPRRLISIFGGIMALASDWKPPFGDSLKNVLIKDLEMGRLDIGCVAAHGHFVFDQEGENYNFFTEGKPATAFLFNLISLLQSSATVPMIDIQAYSQWLSK